MKIILVSFFVFILALNAGGSESLPDFDSAFQEGIKNYQEKKFDQSIASLQKALEIEPKNVSAITNLALAQFQIGQKGMALALLRRALTLDADFPTAQAAYDFILPKLEIKEIPHEILWNETLHTKVLSPLSIFWFSCLTALFIFAAAWSFLAYFGKLKRSKEQDAVPPNLSLLNFIFALGALVFISLLALKALDLTKVRATVVAKEKISVLSSPDAQAPSLFDLYPGLEVLVDKTEDKGSEKWSQVTYPGGPTGWLPNSALFITTEN